MKRLVTVLALLMASSIYATAADLPVKGKVKAADPVPQFSGYIGAWGETLRLTDNLGLEGHSGGWGAEARLNYWLHPSWSFQFDAETDQAHQGGIFLTFPRRENTLVSHLAWRDPQTGAAGLFGGWISSNTTNFREVDKDLGLIGVEAQRYFDALTLYAQAGYADQFRDEFSDNGRNIWFVRFAPRYFVTPNDRISAEVGYASGDINRNPGVDLHIVNWAATYEHKFNTMPVSAFVQYSGVESRFIELGQDRVREHTFVAGLKWYFNQDTLLSNDRTGATFDTPGFIRYLPRISFSNALLP